LKVHYHAQKSPELNLILKKINWVHILTLYVFKIQFTL
jgi:hypothetical protein